MASRWDHLLDLRPVSLIEHALEEVSKLVAADLSHWPLPVSELDAVQGKGLERLFAADYPRPRREVFEESFKLARWELSRETDAYDDYMRNERYQERGLTREHRAELLFVSRWLVEQLLAVTEATGGRIKRKDLLECLGRIQRRTYSPPPG